MFKVSNN